MSLPADLPAFLQKNPWPSELLALGQPIERLWSWELPVPAEALWPYISDTSSFNRRLGLAPMHFEERGGRLYGTQSEGIFRLEWEEVPWHWEYARTLGNARDYSAGFARYVRSRFELEEVAPGRTRFTAYFGWIPRTALGRYLILPVAMRYLEKQYGVVLEQVVRSIQSRAALAPPPVPPPPEDVRARIAAIREEVVREGHVEAALADALIKLALEAPDEELARIRPKRLARALGRPEREVLVALLYATRKGLLTLTWDVICPHCRGARAEMAHLGDVPKRGTCEACKIDFEATGLNALEVTFHLHPTIRKVERQMFCAAEPAKKPHIRIQKRLEPGQALEVRSALGEGRYRLRVLGSWDYNLLSVAPGAQAAPVEWAAQAKGVAFEAAPPPALLLRNALAEPQSFVVEEAAEDAEALRPADLFRLQTFRDLFSEEMVATDVHLDVGSQALLFTDIVGSTRYYEEAGDSVAFAHVQRHFVKAYEAVQSHQGAVVKTIGDAVMAAFGRPVDALKAAVRLMELFPEGSKDSPVRLRASLHFGPCLAVNLDSHVDYFGSTVNYCAKLQALAEAGQIAFSDVLRNDPLVLEYLAAAGFTPEELEFSLKWHKAKSKVYRIEVQSPRPEPGPSAGPPTRSS